MQPRARSAPAASKRLARVNYPAEVLHALFWINSFKLELYMPFPQAVELVPSSKRACPSIHTIYDEGITFWHYQEFSVCLHVQRFVDEAVQTHEAPRAQITQLTASRLNLGRGVARELNRIWQWRVMAPTPIAFTAAAELRGPRQPP